MFEQILSTERKSLYHTKKKNNPKATAKPTDATRTTPTNKIPKQNQCKQTNQQTHTHPKQTMETTANTTTDKTKVQRKLLTPHWLLEELPEL